MDSGHDAETDEDSTPLMSTSDDDYSCEIQQLREENADLRQRLRRAQKKIDEHIIENKNLSDRYYSVGENSVSFKEELGATQVLLLREQENIKELQGYIDRLRSEICKTGQESLIKLFDGIPGSENEAKILPNGHVVQETDKPIAQKMKACHRLSAELDPDDLVLSCTLCSEKMRIDEITSHSRICSAQSQSKNRALHKPDTLIVNVTCSEADIEKASFKIVTRTNLENYNSTHYDVHRSESDCLWLRENLQELCTECVVPPLLQQTTLNGKTRELERFLSRLCQHQILRTSSLLQLFLTGSDEEIQIAKEGFNERQSLKQTPVEHKPSRIDTSDKGTLIKCQKYLESIVKSLSGLINHLRSSLEISSKKGQGRWFKSIAESEPEDTYLKTAAQALSKVCDDLEKGQKEDEKLIIGDLQSVLEYIYSCQKLLGRVESSVNSFLYWEEEVRVCEDMKKNMSKESNTDLTTRWAEANSNYLAAKAHLEMMYKNLSDELYHFDYQKELELREIFIEYTTLKFEHYEKVKSKWEAAIVMTETMLSRDNRAIVFT
ncbi:sorting nexin-7-like isoform X2 [Dendronephthya gigantea]|uniref:sorting nexin-7-like isoform X2 n=1 Tax=Dendronephthya gigantea TaxID=151771 RepID=UPI00106BB522|nr:sorting nexin-7-like isoform X2 [Dendronephthya gigantea]